MSSDNINRNDNNNTNNTNDRQQQQPHQPLLHLPWPIPNGTDLRDKLDGFYRSRNGYHNIQHLSEVLTRLDELESKQVQFDQVPVRLAAWYHDAVYNGKTPHDEEESAQLAEKDLVGIVPDQTIAEVARLVRMTAHHKPALDDYNGAALSDADLAILAASDERYREYVRDVRREYSHFTPVDFAKGRSAILKTFLDKVRLFQTQFAVDHWETIARGNVQREIGELEQVVLAGSNNDGACL